MLLVACAIIEHSGLVLATRRGPDMDQAGLWEFPGGKLNDGEPPADCIRREIAEELGLRIEPVRELPLSVYDGGQRTIGLIPFICTCAGPPVFTLHEHDDARWIAPGSLLSEIEWCPADVPVVKAYLRTASEKDRDAESG